MWSAIEIEGWVAGRRSSVDKARDAAQVIIERVRTGGDAALIELARERNLVLQVGHVERFNPAVAAVADSLVDPMFVESHRLAQFRPRATDVAVVLDLMIHDIDLVLNFVRSPLRSVHASGVAVVSETIDIANARLEFQSGCVANLTASRISQRPMRKMRLFRRDAYISLDFAEPSVEIFRIRDGADIDPRATILLGAIDEGTRRRAIVYEKPPISPTNAISRELEGFIDAIRTGSIPPVTADEGAEALRVAEIILEQIAERNTAETL
jgi:predicted dehydrogenase